MTNLRLKVYFAIAAVCIVTNAIASPSVGWASLISFVSAMISGVMIAWIADATLAKEAP